ncbi:MAG: hypothetical protein HY889_05915 [Deltaproteobacteria bacterium]|nr:hypothetical protein [Deltaproteobacteria bacterium]
MSVENQAVPYNTINTEAYRDEMEKLLVKHGFGPQNLSFVDGFPDDLNPHRVLRCYKIEKKIVFKKIITPEDRADAVAALNLFKDKIAIFKDDWLFVKQALLTEIHRITYRYKSDHECRLWALHEVKF